MTYGNSTQSTPQEAVCRYDGYKRMLGVRFDGQANEAYTYEYGANGRVMRLTDTILERVTESE